MNYISQINIRGYKSIKEEEIHLRKVNVLIGANGSGKSNLLYFFEFLHRLYNQNLQEYIALSGQNKFFFQGTKVTESLQAHLSFADGKNGYSFKLRAGDEHPVFTEEDLWYKNNPWSMSDGTYPPEAQVVTHQKGRGKYINDYLGSYRKYHFHDTGRHSGFTKLGHIENDRYYLYEEGDNLGAFLYVIREEHPIIYRRIVRMVQEIAPFFSDFFLQPNREGYVRLQWRNKHDSMVYGATDFSDGTIRFIALATLFLQPELPAAIIIDEPELGLHPHAIGKFAGMVRSAAARGCQVVMATQSVGLVSQFSPEDILTVNQSEGASTFRRLDTEGLAEWLDTYSLGDLWQRNIISNGQPHSPTP